MVAQFANVHNVQVDPVKYLPAEQDVQTEFALVEQVTVAQPVTGVQAVHNPAAPDAGAKYPVTHYEQTFVPVDPPHVVKA